MASLAKIPFFTAIGLLTVVTNTAQLILTRPFLFQVQQKRAELEQALGIRGT